MNDIIINNINERVNTYDWLFFLGDLIFERKNFEVAVRLRNRIRCQNIVCIWGNHDKRLRKEKLVCERLFKESYDLLHTKINDRAFTMCHYAMRVWNKSHHGAIHLYGHSHGSLPDDQTSLSLDVGVDTHWLEINHPKFIPYSLNEVLDIMNNHKNYVPKDKHGVRK